MGSFVGGLLSRSHDVALIGREAHVSAVRERGLTIFGDEPATYIPEAYTAISDLPWEPDVVLLTVKAYDTRHAGEDISRNVPGVPVLSLQNGLDNIDVLATLLGEERVLAGTTAHGIRLLGPGRLEHTGRGRTRLGTPFPGGDTELVERLCKALTCAGMPARVSSDIRSEIWRKGVVNAGINPLTALLGVRNGAVVEDPHLRECAVTLSREAERVGYALGHRVEGSVDLMLEVAEMTASNRSSMLQDMERGRRTEIDAITGVIVREGERHRVDVTANRTVHMLVQAMERTRGTRRPSPP